MKKTVQVNYKSIFKYDDHHETVQYKAQGTYFKDGQVERITFFQGNKKIEITINQNDVTLVNGHSVLHLTYQQKVLNHYQTPYGFIELSAQLHTLIHERNIKLIYILYDGVEKISEVYMMVNYVLMENI